MLEGDMAQSDSSATDLTGAEALAPKKQKTTYNYDKYVSHREL
jgi:hypothetical protein